MSQSIKSSANGQSDFAWEVTISQEILPELEAALKSNNNEMEGKCTNVRSRNVFDSHLS